MNDNVHIRKPTSSGAIRDRKGLIAEKTTAVCKLVSIQQLNESVHTQTYKCNHNDSQWRSLNRSNHDLQQKNEFVQLGHVWIGRGDVLRKLREESVVFDCLVEEVLC